RRDVARGGDVRAQAERLRRLVCRGGVPGEEPLHDACAAGNYGTIERRSADGGVDDAAAGFVWGDSVRVSVAGHEPVPAVSGRAMVDDGVRLGGEAGPGGLHPEVLSVSK